MPCRFSFIFTRYICFFCNVLRCSSSAPFTPDQPVSAVRQKIHYSGHVIKREAGHCICVIDFSSLCQSLFPTPAFDWTCYTNLHLLNSSNPAHVIRIDPRIVKSFVPGPPVEGSSTPALFVTVNVYVSVVVS